MYNKILQFAISPNELHSSLVLRLSRLRQNDPYVLHGESIIQETRHQNYPCLEENENIDINIPSYEQRRLLASRDPLAIIEAFGLQIVLRLAVLLRVRMCHYCPRYNDCAHICQYHFGSNMRVTGGAFSAKDGFGEAIEYQKNEYATFSRTRSYRLRIPVWNFERHCETTPGKHVYSRRFEIVPILDAS